MDKSRLTMADLLKCADITEEDGFTEVNCKLGHWGVGDDLRPQAVLNAWPIWEGLVNKGVYDELLGLR